MKRNQILDPDKAKTFLKAGRAIITLQSEVTGNHYTYRLTQSNDKRVIFVSVLTEGDRYQYAGLLDNCRIRITKRSKYLPDSIVIKAFNYFGDRLRINRIPKNLTVMHSGRCGRCGRSLTHPDSVHSGIGPECKKLIGR